MKKQLFLLLAMLTSLAGMAQRQLAIGDITMTINPEKGARITSFQYKGQEVISQLKAPESFGSTFWTSPQREWNWPPVKEFDKMPYQVEERDGHLILTSDVSQRLKYRVRKTFSTDKKDNAIVVTYSIINESEETRQVAPWEITRVENNGGAIFFDAPLDDITPADVMQFTASHGVVWYQPDEAAGNRKINADGKGWYAYCNNGLLLLKVFDDLKATQPAPGEAEIQVYVCNLCCLWSYRTSRWCCCCRLLCTDGRICRYEFPRKPLGRHSFTRSWNKHVTDA